MAGRRKGGSAAPRLSALVIDDHDAGRLLAKIILERFGLAVEVACDAAGATENLARRDYDLVLVDRVLGEDDGLALAMRLVAESDAAIVVMSGLLPPETIPEGLAGWLNKPYTPRQMYAVVAEALAGYGKSLAHERIV